VLTFEIIALSLLVAGWLVCAYVPWLVLSIATRGNAGLAMLPLCLGAGLTAAVPLFGVQDVRGLAGSFVVAAAVPAGLLTARRFALGATPPLRQPAPAPDRIEDERPAPAAAAARAENDLP
jgi:hypothetical protein